MCVCDNTSFKSSCLQFIKVGTSGVYHYMIPFVDCVTSLGLSFLICKVELMGLTLPISLHGKDQ